MNLPNKLTLIRIILIPIFLVLMQTGLQWAAAVVFIAASLTDLADGQIARRQGLVTNFGKFADPLADKLLVCAALIALVDRFTVWGVFIILAREFMVSGIRMIAAAEGTVLAAGMSGKIKTVIQMITIVYLLLTDSFKLLLPGAGAATFIDMLGMVLIAASVIMTVYSGAEYLIQNRSLLDYNK